MTKKSFERGYVPKDMDNAFAGDAPKAPVVPTLGIAGTGRFIWRQLTSMRTALILLLVRALVGLRVSEEAERTGLDVTTHGENAYNS